MRLVFLGAPGAGKGTQARQVGAGRGLLQIATGDIFREAATAGSSLGLEAKRYMDQGALVPDGVVVSLVTEWLERPAARKGFVLDGFPRTLAQAEALDRLLAERGLALDRVIVLDVSESELVRRLTGRRVCRRCGASYHRSSSPPRVPGRCDRCGGELYQRDDDREATVRRRLALYEQETPPLLAYYRRRGLLTVVKGEGSVEAVAAAVRAALDGEQPS